MLLRNAYGALTHLRAIKSKNNKKRNKNKRNVKMRFSLRVPGLGLIFCFFVSFDDRR